MRCDRGRKKGNISILPFWVTGWTLRTKAMMRCNRDIEKGNTYILITISKVSSSYTNATCISLIGVRTCR